MGAQAAPAMTMAKDYYQILGIAKTADEKAVKSAYRKLARKHHPDINPNDKGAEARFKEINEAFQVLSDPDKRKLYDQYGENFDKIPPGYDPSANHGPGPGGPGYGPRSGYGPGPGGFSGSVPPNFEEFFGNAARSGGVNFPGARVDFRTGGVPGGVPGGGVPESVDEDSGGLGDLFGELFKGRGGGGDGKTPFNFGRKRGGPRRGSDVEHPLEITVPESVRGTQRRFNLLIRDPEGEEEHRREINVKIPAGVGEGATVKLTGKGAPGENGAPNGDLLLKIQLAPDKIWKREGNNLRIEVPVSFVEAALGAQIQVPTINGEVNLRIPPGTQSGQTFRLTGRGIPNQKTGVAGDQYVSVRVTVPKNLSEKEETLLRELAEQRAENPREDMPKTL